MGMNQAVGFGQRIQSDVRRTPPALRLSLAFMTMTVGTGHDGARHSRILRDHGLDTASGCAGSKLKDLLSTFLLRTEPILRNQRACEKGKKYSEHVCARSALVVEDAIDHDLQGFGGAARSDLLPQACRF